MRTSRARMVFQTLVNSLILGYFVSVFFHGSWVGFFGGYIDVLALWQLLLITTKPFRNSRFLSPNGLNASADTFIWRRENYESV